MSEAPTSDVLSIVEVPVNKENAEQGTIARIIVNRPDKLNALNMDVVSALCEACDWASEATQVRVLVFQGSGPNPPPEGKRAKPNSFIAGADISEFQGVGGEEIRERFRGNAWEAIWAVPKPTIAMVDGFALGGGCEVAMSCDIRMASTRSNFGTPEIKLGLIPGGGGTQRLPRLVGYGNAMEMILSGEMVDAASAYRMGLVNHLCEPEELEGETLALARVIGSRSPHTLQVAKKAVRAALEKPMREGVEDEAVAFAGLFDTEDKEIGVNAFLSRTNPEWVGR